MTKKLTERVNESAAVYGAMLQLGFKKNRPKLSEAEFARRYGREAVAQQRRYCNAFALWRTCPKGRCRRAQRCLGYVTDCLKRAFRMVHPRLHGRGAARAPAQRAAQHQRPRAQGAGEFAGGFLCVAEDGWEGGGLIRPRAAG